MDGTSQCIVVEARSLARRTPIGAIGAASNSVGNVSIWDGGLVIAVQHAQAGAHT